MRIPKDRAPTHPGEMLREEFLKPYNLTVEELADRIKVSEDEIRRLLDERQRVAPDMALRLAKFFGTTPDFWLNGQLVWDLYHVNYGRHAPEIDQIQPVGQ